MVFELLWKVYQEFVYTLTHFLNALLQNKVVLNWSKECLKAFKELKGKFTLTEVLAHYDPTLPIKLDCDASAYGIGTILKIYYIGGCKITIFLSAYQYDLEFRTTDKHCNADGFLQLPISTPSANDGITNVCSVFNVN